MTKSLKLFRFTIQRIHNLSHFMNQFQGVFVSFIYWGLVEHDQHSRTLIKNSCNFTKMKKFKEKLKQDETI